MIEYRLLWIFADFVYWDESVDMKQRINFKQIQEQRLWML